MSDFRKILAIRVGRGGDLVMITPALRALLTACRDAELHLLTMAEGRRVLHGFDPRLNRMWEYDRRFPARLLRERRLLRELRDENYDLVICLETRDFYRRWLGGLTPHWYGLETDPPRGHFVDGCLDLVEGALGRPVVRGGLELPVSEEGRTRARALLAEHGVAPGTRLVGLHATYSGSRTGWRWRDRHGRRHRLWPSGHWVELARRLADGARKRDLPLALVVDVLPTERSLVEPIAAASDGAVTILSAPPDFQRYKGLLAELDLLVTPNTGPMHMAVALGTHVVALFSGWSAADCGPYAPGDRRDVLEPPTADVGLAALDPARVAATVLARLSG